MEEMTEKLFIQMPKQRSVNSHKKKIVSCFEQEQQKCKPEIEN